SSFGDGLFMTGGSVTVVNRHGGTIEGGGNGMVLFSRSTVTNENGSTVRSIHHSPGYSYAMKFVRGGTLINAGSIVGDIEMGFRPDAVNSVTLKAGGSIQGNLAMGTNPLSTLTLGGNNSLPQFYSDAVTGATTFTGTVIKDGDGVWVIDNDDLSTAAGINVKRGVLRSTNMLTGKLNVR